jgi:hypothetical protein
MANNPQFSDAAVEAAVNAVAARENGGFLGIYTGSQPADGNQVLTGTLLVKLALSASAYALATASGSVGARVASALANSITAASAVATGTAGYFALLKADGVTVEAMGSVGTSGCDLNLNSTSITSGIPVSISSFSLSQPEN